MRKEQEPEIVAVGTRGEHGNEPWGPFTVTVRLAAVHGQRVPWRVELEGAGISGEAIRRIPLGEIVADITASVSEGTADLVRRRKALDHQLARIRRREGSHHRGSGLSVEPNLNEVAEVYLEAFRLGLKPRPTIARTWRVTPPTVTRWLEQARDQGLLPPKEG